MFRRGWLYRGRIRSDEGFEVAIIDQSPLEYLEYADGNRKVTIEGELLTDGFALRVTAIVKWDHDGKRIDEETKEKIIRRIRAALQSQGMCVDIM